MRIFVVLFSIAICVAPASAAVTVITNQQQWQDAVGSFSSVTFAGFLQFTIITDQYADLGILFTDGNDTIHNSPSFPSDGHGLRSTQPFGFANITMAFTEPMHWLAFDFIGGLQFELFNDGDLLFASTIYSAGFTPFVGVVSTEPFDAATAHDYFDPTVAVDNIHFGPAIPAPGGLTLVCLGALARSRRRRQ